MQPFDELVRIPVGPRACTDSRQSQVEATIVVVGRCQDAYQDFVETDVLNLHCMSHLEGGFFDVKRARVEDAAYCHDQSKQASPCALRVAMLISPLLNVLGESPVRQTACHGFVEQMFMLGTDEL